MQGILGSSSGQLVHQTSPKLKPRAAKITAAHSSKLQGSNQEGVPCLATEQDPAC